MALHQEKRALAQGLLAGADGAARLSREELLNLIRWGEHMGGPAASAASG